LGLLGGSVNQGTSILQPTIITETLGSFTGSAVNYINGQNQESGFPLENYSGSSIFIVMKRNSIDAANWTINMNGTTGLCMLIGTNPAEIIKTPSLNQADPSIPLGPLFIAASGQSNTFFTATFNDVLGSTSSFSGSEDGNFLGIGGNQSQTTSDISIFEFLIYNRLLNSSEYAQVVSYLKTKYQYNTW
jgi:hypothetical protein